MTNMSSARMLQKSLAVAVYNHYKRINADIRYNDVEIQKK